MHQGCDGRICRKGGVELQKSFEERNGGLDDRRVTRDSWRVHLLFVLYFLVKIILGK